MNKKIKAAVAAERKRCEKIIENCARNCSYEERLFALYAISKIRTA